MNLDRIVSAIFSPKGSILNHKCLLKEYCIENMILLNRKQRTYCLNRLALKVKNAQKIDSDFERDKVSIRKPFVATKKKEAELKSFKVLIEVRAYNEADMREIVEQANDSEIEWFCVVE